MVVTNESTSNGVNGYSPILINAPDSLQMNSKMRFNFLLEASYHLERCSDHLINQSTRITYMQRQIDYCWAVQICPEAIRIHEKLCEQWERYPKLVSSYTKGKYAAIIAHCHYALMDEDKVCLKTVSSNSVLIKNSDARSAS
jgi:hypothetical protein